MKKIIITFAAVAASFAFVSCNKEAVPQNNPANKAKTVIFASTEDGMTKTALDGNDTEGYDVVWSTGDSFTIGGNTFTLTGEAGKTSGTFEGTVPADGEYTVYYPTSYDGTAWPTAQTYVEGNIAGSPMKASVSVADGKVPSIEFKNEGGILRLNVKGTVTVKSIEISATTLSTITLDCGSGVALTSEGTVFHIAMPAGTYSGTSIVLTDTEGKTCTKSLKSRDLVIERSKITPSTFTASDFKSPVTYNVGDIVTVDSHEGIVVNINGDKVIVATMNVGATAVNDSGFLGETMTYDAACTAWTSWRLPTVEELETLCDAYYPGVCGNTDIGGCTGAVMWDIDGVDGIDLYLPLNDYDEVEGMYPCDKYWTGTTDDGGNTYYYFAPELDWEDNYYPIAYDYRFDVYKEAVEKDNELLVRLFHDI